MMKLLTAVALVTTWTAMVLSDDQLSGVVNPIRRDAPFQAYWLIASHDGKQIEYQHLLLTHGPIEELGGHNAWSALPLDNMAMTFRTYKRDSLWNKPFLCVKDFGAIDAKSKTAVVDGSTFQYDICPLTDVIRLLEKPSGSLPISRISDPLEGAAITAKAFRLLLEEQLDAEKANK